MGSLQRREGREGKGTGGEGGRRRGEERGRKSAYRDDAPKQKS